MKVFWSIGAVAIALLQCALTATPPVLPIYLEDNHSGSFYHLAATLDLDEPHALVLIDTHTDASAAPGSDRIREGLRRVLSTRGRNTKIAQWRQEGRVQAFDWIEPLMPLPFSSVWWVAPDTVTEDASDAREFLDGRLKSEARECGELGERFRQVKLDALAGTLPKDTPVIVSLDLDYFSAMSPAEIDREFPALWKTILTLPHLSVITLCLSRPWLADDTQAFDLCQRALAAALSLRNATVRFEPFATEGPDRSEKAQEYYRRGEVPPRFDVTTAPAGLRSLLLANAERLDVRYEPERWEKLLDRWRTENGAWRIVAEDSQPSTDGVWRMRGTANLRVTSHPRQPVPHQVRWLSLRPEHSVYNVLPEVPGSKTFAHAAPPVVRDIETEIVVSEDGALAAAEWQSLLDTKTGWGSVRIVAEISSGGGEVWQRTPEIELRVFTGEGFRAGLSEQFNLPYIFGAGFLGQGGETGPETLAGNDCANFLIYAWRRSGKRLSWGDPLQMARQLDRIAVDLDGNSQTQIPHGAIERGLAIHAGKHAAAIWEDREPLGVVDGNDIVAHHLTGTPQLITLRELLNARPDPTYDLLQMPAGDVAFRLVAGGDVTFHGLDPNSANPLGNFPSFIKSADLSVANLECAMTESTDAAHEKTFLFRSDPGTIRWLAEAGIDGLSLANNHSTDFGKRGLRDTIAAIGDTKLENFGLEPWMVDSAAGKLAFFGINYIENESIEADIETLSVNISKAGGADTTIIVMPHWGREYTDKTTVEQRTQARRLINDGADIIIGSHPHHHQPLDFYQGRPIYYSLGNAFFPGDEGPPGFHEASWAQIEFGTGGKIESATVSRDSSR